MIENPQFHHLTFVTKYSRTPSEEIALIRYYAMMDIGQEPLLFDAQGTELIGNAFRKQAQMLGIKIIVANILPDHAHIIIDSNDKSISEIVQQFKGYSSYIYNHTFKHKGPIWAVGYSDMYIDSEKYLENAIAYVKNNHLKHKSIVNYVTGDLP